MADVAMVDIVKQIESTPEQTVDENQTIYIDDGTRSIANSFMKFSKLDSFDKIDYALEQHLNLISKNQPNKLNNRNKLSNKQKNKNKNKRKIAAASRRKNRS